jgi:hypothetical protein
VVLNLHNHTYEVADGEHDLKGTLARLPEARVRMVQSNQQLRAGNPPQRSDSLTIAPTDLF